ncbi:hypothetical protein CDL15_Pgr002742 [Punica granatum]|uniref:Uncharacterized protein n=1 Tax=Punica granatum TaxID=22663 RepID=A0A218X087_PUNGR|nr:hypothetical protein CDL15_Pgr002742 [Punica granatum]PKI68608.1 hypothetical protein CRG98_011012 [Punica granatum]
MDLGSRKTFDLSYCSNVLKRRGLLQPDVTLTDNSVTLANIKRLLARSLENFDSRVCLVHGEDGAEQCHD